MSCVGVWVGECAVCGWQHL